YPPPPPDPPPRPEEDVVEADEPFPETGPEDPAEYPADLPPDEILLDDEAPADDLSFSGGEEESAGSESPEEESIFEEETPEIFSDPVLEEPDLPGEEDLILETEHPPASGEEPAVEEPPQSEEEPPAEAVPEILPETDLPSPEEVAPASDPAAPVPAEPAVVVMTPGEKKEPPEFKKDDMLGLMNYLKHLAGSLPGKDRDAFLQSDARLSMEYIIDTLEGRKGLIREIEARSPGTAAVTPDGAAPPASLGKMAALRAASDAEEAAAAARGKPKKRRKPDVAGMLAFMAKLAGTLPDAALGKAISRKVDTVITDIKHSETDNGTRHG
ncbi:MAG: hypothetical protein LBG10_07690, partial [Treponema sp.]|nr:hypothetical protein [Treponema sp.]